MKYDVLERYRSYLNGAIDNKNTADRYYFAVAKCLRNIQFDTLSDVSDKHIEEYLIKLKGSGNFSALKNGLKHLGNFDISFKIPEDDFFKRVAKSKRRGTKRGIKTIILDMVQKKINALKNEKLKIGYRLMQLSGLRVSELASIKKENIKIDGQIITVDVKKGKGGKSGKVICDPDRYLSERLQKYLKRYSEQDNIFYTAETMKKYAKRLGIECHDLRRIAAITHRNKLKDSGMSIKEANKDTKEYLRHERFSTTKRYLFNRKLKFKDENVNILKEDCYINELKDDLNYIVEAPESITELIPVRKQEKKIVNKKVEYAYVYDQDGKELFNKSDGKANQVAFTASETAMMKGAVLTHNHPGGSTFSEADIYTLVETGMKEMRATGANGTFFLRKVDHSISAKLFYDDYTKAINNIYPLTDPIYNKIQRKYANKELTDEEYKKNIEKLNALFMFKRHEWIKNNAKNYGYKYGIEKNRR